jgi:hypothetical protein
MVRNEATLIKALEFLCTNTSPTACARHLGMSPKIIWTWGRASAKDEWQKIPPSESAFGVHWPNDDPESEPIYFHHALTQARVIFLALASMEATALIGPNAGHTRVARDGSGRVMFKVDRKVAADALSMDSWDWEMRYGTRDRKDIFERDADGCLVVDTYVEPLPSQLKIHLLRSLLPSQFNPENKSTTEMIHAAGLVIVGEHRDKPPNALRDDMEARLARVLAGRSGHDNPNSTKKPNAPVQILGRGESGPPEKVSQPSNETPVPLDQHPRAYTAAPALPAPKPEAPQDFRRPTKRLDATDRVGNMPPGGFSASTGRPT